MAETLCGPSNALQNFQKHTSVDRTLQQDRLGYYNQPSQSFRSTPRNSAGYLDADFQAFQAGPLDPFAAPLQNNGLPVQKNLPRWAFDFQQLDLNDTKGSPIPTSQFKQEAPLERSAAGSWHHDFRRQQDRSLMPYISVAAPKDVSRWVKPASPHLPYSTGPFQSQYSGYRHLPMETSPMSFIAQQKQPEQQPTGIDLFDEDSFERAFDAAAVEAITAEAPVEVLGQNQPTQNDHFQIEPEQLDMSNACVDPGDILGDFDFDNFILENGHFPGAPAQAEQRELYPFSAFESEIDVRDHDAVDHEYEHVMQELDNGLAPQLHIDEPYPFYNNDDLDPALFVEELAKKPQAESNQADEDAQADDLSRTAGQLLDNLKHEQNEKFQNSSFLALMRQLRDKEVRVEGDKMVDTTQALHPGGPFYPNEIAAASDTSKHATVSDDTEHESMDVSGESHAGG